MPAPDYPLQTARLTLRPFGAEDLDDLFAFHSLPAVARFLYWESRDREEAREALARKLSQTRLAAEGDTLCLAVVLPDTGTVIGEVSLGWQSREHRQGELGYVFHPGYGGRGYATEAARAVLALGFDGLGLHRIYGRCDADNAPSYRLMARLGMRREAHFVHNEWFKGAWSSELVYALLRDEWRAQEKAKA
jgi:RimJ/RimL family protein N-acetyltransferase